MIIKLALYVFLGLAFALPAAAMTYEPYTIAVLQGLDKVTGRVEKFELPENGNTRFGTLYVTARACKKTPPEELPEAVAFVEIDEVKPGDTKLESNKRWYSGWMFASNPSLAALEHPVYDVAVVDCKQPKNAQPETKTDTKAALPPAEPSAASKN